MRYVWWPTRANCEIVCFFSKHEYQGIFNRVVFCTEKLDVSITSCLLHRPVKVVRHGNRNDVVYGKLCNILLPTPSPCTLLIAVPDCVLVNSVAELTYLLLEKRVAHILSSSTDERGKFSRIVTLGTLNELLTLCHVGWSFLLYDYPPTIGACLRY